MTRKYVVERTGGLVNAWSATDADRPCFGMLDASPVGALAALIAAEEQAAQLPGPRGAAARARLSGDLNLCKQCGRDAKVDGPCGAVECR